MQWRERVVSALRVMKDADADETATKVNFLPAFSSSVACYVLGLGLIFAFSCRLRKSIMWTVIDPYKRMVS